MAVLKHIASKNTDYSQIIDYMLFQHDEITMEPILDENGRMILRDEYYIDDINCEAMLFDKECKKLNSSYHKNQHYDDIKSHHYILSFDPKDKDDHGLTGERAQALGMEYAKKKFPRSSGSRLYAYGRSQWKRKYPCTHHHKFFAKTGCGAATFHGTSLRQPGRL